jgi:alpha-tubulin suppressor-like RCC1 family protein
MNRKKKSLFWSAALSLLLTASFSPVGVQTVGACEAHPTPVQISTWNHALVLGMDGSVWAWGDNTQGNVGDGTKTHRYEPVKVLDDAKDISASKNYFSVALKNDGTVWAWGSNYGGQIGLTTSDPVTTPTQVNGLTDVVNVEAGGNFGIALKNDGTVWTWGSNAGGALGNGSTVVKSIVPVQVSGLENVKQIGAGVFTGYALKNDGTVWAWGLNTKGELGNGGKGSQSNVPVQVENLTDIVEISVGLDYAMALKSDGTVWVWGSNDNGQLGIGKYGMQKSPVQIPTLSSIKDIEASRFGSFAIDSEGTVWAWGRDVGNILADGTNTSETYLEPIKIENLSGFISLAPGNTFALGIKNDGTLWAWGFNLYGGLGTGKNNPEYTSIPVRVPIF